MSAMRARHSTLEQFIANEVEYKSSSERMVIRQRIHPTAAQVLREFAAQVIEHDVVAHKKRPAANRGARCSAMSFWHRRLSH